MAEPPASRGLSPAPGGPYRAQSNDPVRRGVLRFRSCARPGPPWRRYRSHRAGCLENRSLLLKEPEHDRCHAHPAEGRLENPRPLDTQLVERVLILRRERRLLDLLTEHLQVADHQVGQVAEYRDLAPDLRRVAQQLRDQQPSLAIHLDRLPVIVHPVEKLLLRRIEGGERRQLLLDPFPLLEGIHLCTLAVQAGDVKLLPVFLVDHALEFRGNLEPALVVDPSWMISAKHVYCPFSGPGTAEQLPLPKRGRSKGQECRSDWVRWGSF